MIGFRIIKKTNGEVANPFSHMQIIGNNEVFVSVDSDHDILSEFTGRTDMVGNNIYAHDVVKCGDSLNCKFATVVKGEIEWELVSGSVFDGLDYFLDDIEVVGNMYQEKFKGSYV